MSFMSAAGILGPNLVYNIFWNEYLDIFAQHGSHKPHGIFNKTFYKTCFATNSVVSLCNMKLNKNLPQTRW